ncbi:MULTISPECIES: IclR family transcriptional regulator [Rhodococcus]|uniref:Probable transcriptional regulator, IclR family protein n=1 Tax=Rhodococcus jostii (strain RHA1) TaxID=101510 RepID=Q0SCD8_RHOJR|nr:MULTISPECIES: IclR family transcriptional regulator C-terminal domain-containing protein [Rhodococcus]ABG94798.1 probable transcriptional regulator, IclR family protein [Rhodococcus jostii RHA1]
MNAIQLLTKAGQIVDELARLGPSTPAELAKVVAEPRPSVYRILTALEQISVVRQAGEGRLELGIGLLRWSDAAVEAFVDKGELRRQLRWVREQLGMNVFFCVPHEHGVLSLDQVDGAVVDMLDLGPGRMLPRFAGAAPRALLAFESPEVQDSVCAGAPFGRLASGTPTTAQDLRELLDNTIARGWSVDDSEVVEGVASVAVPVRRDDGGVAGAIAVAGLRESVLAQQDVAGRVLTVAAEALAAAMARAQATGPRSDATHNGVAQPSETRAPALIVRAGALMEALARERIATSTRLTEILDEPVSSVYRMLATLSEIGWVEQIGHRGAYRVGGRLLSLSGELTRRLDIRRAAGPVLRAIHEATGETTFMCVRHGTRAVCIERVDGIRVNSRVLRLGRSLPLHVGAAPRALLAFEDRAAWDEYASAALSEDLLHMGSRSTLYAELDEIRSLGFALSDNTVTPGIAAVGAPIFDHRGDVAASLSVSGLRDGVLAQPAHGRSVTDLVLWGAAELSRYLGFDVARLSEAPRSSAANALPS